MKNLVEVVFRNSVIYNFSEIGFVRKISKPLLFFLFFILLFPVMTGLADADVIYFDDITTGDFEAVPLEYCGFNWGTNEFGVVSDNAYSSYHYNNTYGSPSGEYAAFNDRGKENLIVTSISGNNFVFNGAYFSGWAQEDQCFEFTATSITVYGYRDEVLVGTVSMDLSNSQYDWLKADMDGINKLQFVSSGNNKFWIMDDFTFNENIPADAIAPEIAVTYPTSGATYETNVSTLDISGTASDNVGVISVTWFSSGSGNGTAIGTKNWSISNIELVEGNNIITIWAKDAAGNENGATLKVTYTPPQPTPVISDLTVASDATCVVVDGLDNGSKAYVDSGSTYSNLPNVLKNATYIRTSINDKTSTTKPFISFTVNKNVSVCFAYDDRIDPKPSWLPVRTDTGTDLLIGNEVMSIYAKFVRAGKEVKLGGNEGDINSNMYTVIIVER
ncbi:MAG: hypothetical protein HF982_14240 [Desulfobacteraceae bacterium]|nr:hypothetical protein [Desulfobacteraceae bacterium]MBC2720717.1 Ig-like domain-containing protein [Desulfobacteraceae bacterium]